MATVGVKRLSVLLTQRSIDIVNIIINIHDVYGTEASDRKSTACDVSAKTNRGFETMHKEVIVCHCHSASCRPIRAR